MAQQVNSGSGAARSFTRRAYAKVNLRLKVEGRRADGYHLLSMLNCNVDFFDEVSLVLNDNSGEISLVLEADQGQTVLEELYNVEDNLASRAAILFLKRFAPAAGCRISLLKRLPLGAGLGGGSSDAAAVLSMLAEALAVELDELGELALSLGADVPYALHGGLAMVGGIGEQVQPLRCLEEGSPQIFLVLPPYAIATKEIFALYRAKYPELELRRDAALHDFSARALSHQDLLALVSNDLEESAVDFRPELGALLAELRSAGWLTGMTGSGSTLFILPDVEQSFSESDAGKLREILERYRARLFPSRLLLKTGPCFQPHCR